MNIPLQGFSADENGVYVDNVKLENATIVYHNGLWHITVTNSVAPYGHGSTPMEALQSWMNNTHWRGFPKPSFINKDLSK